MIQTTSDDLETIHERVLHDYRERVYDEQIPAKDLDSDVAYTWPEHYVARSTPDGAEVEGTPLLETSQAMDLPLRESVNTLGWMSHNVYAPDADFRASIVVIEGGYGESDSLMGETKTGFREALEEFGIGPHDMTDERIVSVSSVSPTGERQISIAPILQHGIVGIGDEQHLRPETAITGTFEIASAFWHGRLMKIEEE